MKYNKYALIKINYRNSCNTNNKDELNEDSITEN